MLLNSIGYWVISSWRPKFTLKLHSIKHLLSYNLHVTIFNIISYFSEQSDIIIIGKFFGSELLGFYVLANQVIFRPLNQIFLVFRRTLFPILSSIQKQLPEFQKTYIKSLHGLLAIVAPIFVVAFFTAPWFFPMIFGEKWMKSVQIFQVFSLRGLIYTFISPVGLIFFSIGSPQKYWKYHLLYILPLNILGILVGVILRAKILDVAIFLTLANLIYTVPLLKFSFSLIKIKLLNFFTEIKEILYGLVSIIIFLTSFYYFIGSQLFFTSKVMIPVILLSFGFYISFVYFRDKFIRDSLFSFFKVNNKIQ